MVNEAQTLRRLGRVPEAIQAYERVLAVCPTLATCWFNLGVLQRQARQLDAALASYQKALDSGIAEPEEVHLNRSVIFADYLRQEETAERELQKALTINPSYVPALLNLANLHEDLGRKLEATQTYERLLAIAPTCYEALARFANLQPLPQPDASLRNRLETALADPAATAADRASLGFSLGRLLDGSQDYEAAFEAYSAANRQSRLSVPPQLAVYDRTAQEQLTDRLMQGVWAPALAESPPPASPTPIFICGMFRSGSTLAEQLLAAHPDVRAGGELDFLPRLAGRLAPFPESMRVISPGQLNALAHSHLSELHRLFPQAKWVTDKRPDNFLLIGLIKSLFPKAKIVHTTRDPLDNCLSVFFLHLDQRMSYALDLMDIGHYFRQYRRLMNHWKHAFGPDIFDFDYDAFVREPQKTAEQLFAFLGLEWDEAWLDRRHFGAIKTASVWQVRQPLHTRSSGRSRHYSVQLAELADYLADPPGP